MQPGGRTLIRRWPDTPAERVRITAPRDDIVHEEPEQTAHESWAWGQTEGPFTVYRRTVVVEGASLVETTTYRFVIPWFAWLFGWPIRRVISRRGSSSSWWAPPDRLDPTQLLVLGLLAAASMSAAFVNTLFTQTVNFAADDFGVGDTAIGVAGAAVRAGVVIALPAAVIADRIGRRRVILGVAWLAPVFSILGAAATSFPILVATQTIARPMGIALAFLVGVVAAEEMPRSTRAYAVSILAMAAGLGAGVAVIALSLADINAGGWRYVYLVAAIWCVVAIDLTRRLPETRRFELAHIDARARPPRINLSRLAVLGAAAFAGSLFVAPASFFQNNYLTDERGFSGAMIAVFSILIGTPAGLGLVLGGRIADTRGRRRLIAVTVPLGTAGIVAAFTYGGVALWLFSLAGGLLLSAAYPALAVYRTELFPTENRSRATGLVTASSLVGGIVGLVVMGALLDADLSYTVVLGLLAIGQLVVVVLVVVAYPETAHLELEALNPEDEPVDIHRLHAEAARVADPADPPVTRGD